MFHIDQRILETRLGGRGHLTVDYTGTQSLIIKKSYSLAQKRLVLLINFNSLAPNYW